MVVSSFDKKILLISHLVPVFFVKMTTILKMDLPPIVRDTLRPNKYYTLHIDIEWPAESLV